MSRLSPRKDRETAAQINAALAMQQEFGADAARVFLNQRGVRPELAERTLTAPPDQRRDYSALKNARRA